MHVGQLDDLASPLAAVDAPPFRHQGVAKPRPLRLARLIAELTNAIDQQPPSLFAVTDTSPIREDERFDESRVARYLHSTLPELFPCEDVEFDQFPGGAANLTYRARCADGEEWVLRRAPLGEVARGGHDMAREYKVLSRLWQEFPLAPRAHHYCENDDVMGKPFFVMERRRGSVVRDEWPGGFTEQTGRKRTSAESLVDALCALHAVDPAAVGLRDLGRPEGFVQRQIEGWTLRWDAAATRPVADMDIAAALLREGCS